MLRTRGCGSRPAEWRASWVRRRSLARRARSLTTVPKSQDGGVQRDGTLSHALAMWDDTFAEYSALFRKKHRPADDWLAVTVDCHL